MNEKTSNPTNEELKTADAALSIMVLVKGTLASEEKFWAYLAVPPSKYLAFKRAEAAGAYNMGDYGEIVEIGIGESEPSEEIKRKMEQDYDVNHNFEDDMRQKAQEIDS